MGINSSKDGSVDSITNINNAVNATIPASRREKRMQQNFDDLPSSPRPSALIPPGTQRMSPQPLVINESESVVPNVFRWDHGGRNVYITGTFNNWERQIPMHRSGNDFSYVHNLKKGKHAYKFIVEDEWRFAPDQPTVADIEGHINNFIDVSDFTPYTGDYTFFEKSKECKISDDDCKQVIPDLDEYTKEPPGLPPHLRHIILNKPPPTYDPTSLPVPQQVSLNHLYCTAIKDGMMVLGATQRYREKYTTVVFYSVMPASG